MNIFFWLCMSYLLFCLLLIISVFSYSIDTVRTKRIELGEIKYKMAMAFKDGNNVPKDYKKAAKYFQQAADLDLDKAKLALGCLYLDESGVERPLCQASYRL